MSFTSVDAVAAHFPGFARGGSSQKPADSYITTWIADISGEIEAVLLRRFGESINESGGALANWEAGLPAAATAVLEKVNRYGAAAQLGATLASLGANNLKGISDTLQRNYDTMLKALDARDARGNPLPSGPYDRYFDTLARIETPRPVLAGVAGGDQPSGQTSEDLGLSNLFSRDQVI